MKIKLFEEGIKHYTWYYDPRRLNLYIYIYIKQKAQSKIYFKIGRGGRRVRRRIQKRIQK
jgi:hypothetical protein